jgi:broad specificity phosphatase PhoE
VTILLLRHVDAGDRHRWDGDDRSRPPSPLGLRQAAGLVDAYADREVVAIVTSPYARCVGSVEPLAAARGLPVEEAHELAEGAPSDLIDRFLRAQCRRVAGTTGAVVLCTHGDVLEAILTALGHRGVVLPAGEVPQAKGSTWVLDGPADEPTLTYVPPAPPT